jgi:Uma2 family endonuclease
MSDNEGSMGTITKLTFQEYEQLPEQEGVRYELDEGTLVMAPSPTWWHNDIRDYIANRLRGFVKTHGLGRVTVETEFQLSPDTARTPDIAFVTSEKLKSLDRRHSPIFGAPDLAVEVISPGNRAEDTVKKIHQYLGAGCHCVWIVYPGLRRAEMHSQAGVQNLRESDVLKEETLLPRFSLALSEIFEADEVR